MSEKGFSETRLATAAGVDVKTVGRWVRGESLPQAVNARATADALGCDPQTLWPDIFPTLRPPGTGTVAVSVYRSRADVPVAVWTQLFGGAAEQIDILVYGGTFLFDGIPRFCSMLAVAAERGVAIRFIVGDPDCAAVGQRGDEETIGSVLAARCQITLARLASLADAPGLEVRTHATPLYTSMFRADNTLIANPHLYGAPASDNPVLFIRRDDAPGLWRDHQLSFERVWNTAQPLPTPA
ncbi:helix-turn-helix domain-containing protein [Mycobacterium sp. SA01]|uniref:helix-turn-helix domain-containing protein n=1 Tax=Mycobacterium sp. SA01 TaxID=3238820 RepID=UPI00351BDA39